MHSSCCCCCFCCSVPSLSPQGLRLPQRLRRILLLLLCATTAKPSTATTVMTKPPRPRPPYSSFSVFMSSSASSKSRAFQVCLSQYRYRALYFVISIPYIIIGYLVGVGNCSSCEVGSGMAKGQSLSASLLGLNRGEGNFTEESLHKGYARSMSGA